MQEILQKLLERLQGCGAGEVYASFDALPVEKKSHSCFTVVGLEQVKTGEGYPVEKGVAYPFTAQLRVDLLTPMTENPQESQRLFFEKIVPAMAQEECSLLRFDAGAPKPDLRLGRMVYGGTFCLLGVLCTQKEDDAA